MPPQVLLKQWKQKELEEEEGETDNVHTDTGVDEWCVLSADLCVTLFAPPLNLLNEVHLCAPMLL